MNQATKLLALAALFMAGCATVPPGNPAACESHESAFLGQYKARDLKAAAKTFSTLIEECPATVKGPLRGRSAAFVRELRDDQSMDAASYRILDGLLAIGWTADSDRETDYFWLQLTQQHLEHGNLKAARRSAQAVFMPGSLLQMRVDRRFDAIVNADPSHFDVAAALERQVARARTRSDAAPRAIQPRLEYVNALVSAARYDEALETANDVLRRGADAFDDFDAQSPWILTTRSTALRSLGRVDEVLADLEAAEKKATGTRIYVNFALNLGDAQERAGHAVDALTTFQKVGPTSSYGSLILQVGIANAARQTGDMPRAEAALLKAEEFRWNNVRQYTGALLRAGRLNEARDLLLKRLELPNWRGQALSEVQNYREPPRLPMEMEEIAKFRELVNLPDVQAAILKVGRIETFAFPRQ